MSVRLAFLGNDPWSVPSLRAIAHDPELEVVAVVTNLPKPAGRDSALTPTPVARASRELGFPLVETDGVRGGTGLEALRGAAADVLVVVAYGEILTPAALAMPRWGAINLHFSRLPRWRGAAPVQHALLAGDTTTGVSVMRMDEGLDTGPVLAQRDEPIRADDDAGSLGARLAAIGADVLVGVLQRLPAGDLPEQPQDPEQATSAPRPKPEDRRIGWADPAKAIVRRVRAFGPDPAATTTFRGNGLKVFRADVVEGTTDPGRRGSVMPGTILGTGDRGVEVAAGEHQVRLLDVALAGRKRMAAIEWARGARFLPGERLG